MKELEFQKEKEFLFKKLIYIREVSRFAKFFLWSTKLIRLVLFIFIVSICDILLTFGFSTITLGYMPIWAKKECVL